MTGAIVLGLAAVVGGGFGVDEEAADLRGVELEGVLEGGDDGVNAGHGEVVWEGAVAAHLEAVGGFVGAVAGLVFLGAAEAGDDHLVDVEDLRKGFGDVAESVFQVAVAVERGRLFDGGGLAFDVVEDGGWRGSRGASRLRGR